MSKHQGAPMPAELRHMMRAAQHPARSVDCPHCGAHARRPCTTPSKRRTLPQPHPQRVNAWARATACCPECQVEPGAPCHDEGVPRFTVHSRRYQEAEEMAA
ncbi:MAG: hypothetical protein LBV78_24200 [Kitasatospora sp.]|jgi:hypothetical protein|nr:hypothetical protein [Kitasatospora sp.]